MNKKHWQGELHKQTSEATPGLASIHGTSGNRAKTPVCIADEIRENNADHMINCWNAMEGVDPQALPVGQVRKLADQVQNVLDYRVDQNSKIITIKMPTADYIELINMHNSFVFHP